MTSAAIQLKKVGSGREILTAALNEAMKRPLFVSSAEKAFSKSPFIQEAPSKPLKPARTTEIQTDEFLAKPASKPYVPRKTGKDSSCQVENAVVFDFDFEVSPIVNSLVSKIIEQSTLELHEETTLAKIRAFKAAAALRRDAEISTWEKAVAVESSRHAEAVDMERRTREALELEKKLRGQQFLSGMAGKYLANLIPETLKHLQKDFGVFENEKILEIEKNFIPKLLKTTVQILNDNTHERVKQILMS